MLNYLIGDYGMLSLNGMNWVHFERNFGVEPFDRNLQSNLQIMIAISLMFERMERKQFRNTVHQFERDTILIICYTECHLPDKKEMRVFSWNGKLFQVYVCFFSV